MRASDTKAETIWPLAAARRPPANGEAPLGACKCSICRPAGPAGAPDR